MSKFDERTLFLRELRRLLDDYERSPGQTKPVIIEHVLVIADALQKKEVT